MNIIIAVLRLYPQLYHKNKMIVFDDKIYIGRMLRPIKEDTKFQLTGMNFKLSAGYLYLKNHTKIILLWLSEFHITQAAFNTSICDPLSENPPFSHIP